MMTRRSSIPTVLLLLAVCVPLSVEGKLVLYSFEEMVLSSSSIIIGEVQSTTGGLIRRPHARVAVIRLIKGTMPENPLVLRYGDPTLAIYAHEDPTQLNEGHQYVMFLAEDKKEYRLVGADAGIYEINAKGQVCDEGTMVLVDKFITKVLAVPPRAAETQK